MVRRWINKTLPPSSEIERLSTQINVNPCLSAILLQSAVSLPALSWEGRDEAFRSDRDFRRAEDHRFDAALDRQEGRFRRAWRDDRRARHDEFFARRHGRRSAYRGGWFRDF